MSKITVDIPRLPKFEIKLLTTERFDAGSNVLSYVSNVMKVPLSDEFSNLCQQVNEMREQLRTLEELTSIDAQLYVDYYTLLPCLAQGLDVSNRGMNLQFKWESVIFNIIESDIVFFGYNMIVSLLKSVTQIEIRMKDDIQSIINFLKPAQAIFDIITKMYIDDFKPVISLDKIQALTKYIYCFWNYAFLRNTMLQNASSDLQGRASYEYSKKLKLINPPQNDLSTFFEMFACAKMFEAYKDENPKDSSIDTKYGVAIAYGTRGISLYPQTPEPAGRKKSKTPPPLSELQNMLQPLYQELQRSVNLLEKDNLKIYFQTPPKEVEIPNLKIPDFPQFKWEPTTKPVSFESSVLEVASAQVQARISEIKQKITDGGAKISQIRAMYPYDLEAKVDEKAATLRAKKEMFLAEQKKVASMINGREGARHPEIQQQFSSMQQYVTKSAKSDLFYESKLGAAKANLRPLAERINGLDPIQSQLQQVLESFDTASSQAIMGLGSPEFHQVLSSSQHFNQFYDSSSAMLQDLTQQIDNIYEDVNSLDIDVQQFKADLNEVSKGFDGGIKCYTDLYDNFVKMGSGLSR